MVALLLGVIIIPLCFFFHPRKKKIKKSNLDKKTKERNKKAYYSRLIKVREKKVRLTY